MFMFMFKAAVRGRP